MSDENNKCKDFFCIIVPVYNAENTLKKCLDSIVEQDFNDFSLVIIDDGSTDSSSNICKSYANKYPNVSYYRVQNGGALKARIIGLSKVCSRYFMFCDSDDYYLDKKMLSKLHTYLNEREYSLIQFPYRKKYNHVTRTVFKTPKYFSSELEFMQNEYPILLCSFWSKSNLTHSLINKVYNSNLLSGFDFKATFPRLFWGDDAILNLILLNQCKSALFISDTFYCHQALVGGTKTFREDTMKDLDVIKKSQSYFLSKYDGSDKKKMEWIKNYEVVGWLVHYLDQCKELMTDEKIRAKIIEIFEYPEFKKIQKYIECNNDNSIESNLFIKGDPTEYLEFIDKRATDKNIDKIKAKIRNILYRI